MKNDKRTRLIFSYGSIIFLVIFCCLSWLFCDVVSEHVPVSCLGIFLACFVANASILLPSPGIALVVQFAMKINPVVVVIMGALGASLGEMVGFYLGRQGRRMLPKKVKMFLVKTTPKYPYFWILGFAMLPLPIFDVVGIIAGAERLKPQIFYVFCFIGKLVKFGCFVAVAIILCEAI